MNSIRLPALALTAILGLSAVAQAQTPPPPGGGMAGRHGLHGGAQLQAMHDALKVRPDQEAAFSALGASLKHGGEGGKPQGMATDPAALAAMPAPQRLDALGRMMDDRVARLRERFQSRAAAVKTFYAVLSPEQKRALDASPDLMGFARGGMGMGGMEHGPRGMGHPGGKGGDES